MALQFYFIISQAYNRSVFIAFFSFRCWINTQSVSYITVNGYLGLVMLFNMVMLGVVLVKMHRLRSQNLQIKDQRRRVWKEWVSLLGLSCVLGVPWVLAFSTYGPLSLPALYVFTILNSLQGKHLLQCYLKQKHVLIRLNHINCHFH